MTWFRVSRLFYVVYHMQLPSMDLDGNRVMVSVSGFRFHFRKIWLQGSMICTTVESNCRAMTCRVWFSKRIITGIFKERFTFYLTRIPDRTCYYLGFFYCLLLICKGVILSLNFIRIGSDLIPWIWLESGCLNSFSSIELWNWLLLCLFLTSCTFGKLYGGFSSFSVKM